MNVACEWEFQLTGTQVVSRVRESGDRIMTGLLALESADARLADSSVSLDSSTGTLTVGITVSGTDYQESVDHALTSIRAAIHAAGGSTPDWDLSESTLEPHDFRAAAL